MQTVVELRENTRIKKFTTSFQFKTENRAQNSSTLPQSVIPNQTIVVVDIDEDKIRKSDINKFIK